MDKGLNFKFRKKRDYTVYSAKIKVLICSAVTTQLVCTFVFTYAKTRFSYDVTHLVFLLPMFFLKMPFLPLSGSEVRQLAVQSPKNLIVHEDWIKVSVTFKWFMSSLSLIHPYEPGH